MTNSRAKFTYSASSSYQCHLPWPGIFFSLCHTHLSVASSISVGIGCLASCVSASCLSKRAALDGFRLGGWSVLGLPGSLEEGATYECSAGFVGWQTWFCKRSILPILLHLVQITLRLASWNFRTLGLSVISWKLILWLHMGQFIDSLCACL